MCLGCYVFTTVLKGSSNELPFCLQIFAAMADDSRRRKKEDVTPYNLNPLQHCARCQENIIGLRYSIASWKIQIIT